MFFLTNIILYVVALQLVHAIPLVKRIVIDPHITSPSAGTVWTPGNTEVVTWDTSLIPPTGNFPGMVLLGFLTPGSENLDTEQPLAQGFSLRDGSVSVTCPPFPPGNNYIVVLFGDSGNASPQFTIASTNGTSGTPASPSSSQPSPTEPVTSQQASATPTTPVPSSPMASASNSDVSTLAPTLTPSASVTTPPPVSSPAASTTSKTSSASSATALPADSNRNNAISLNWNLGTMVACTVVTIFAMFSF